VQNELRNILVSHYKKYICKLKIIFIFTIGFFLISCSSDSNSSSSSGLYKWSFKLDGVLYQWQGNQLTNPNSGGSAAYGANASGLTLNKNSNNLQNSVTVNVIFPTATTGNFVFNSNSPGLENFVIVLLENNQIIGQYSSALGGSMNVNVSSLSPNTIVSNPNNPGKVIGTFSGTIKSVSGNTVSISDGTFEAVRAQ
jgi:hypothetical protein